VIKTRSGFSRQTLGGWFNVTVDSIFEEAQNFVGNTGENYIVVGQLQLELLMMNGCTPDSHVLEIGCGCLVAGRPIIAYLQPDRYVGIEPNTWLLDAVKKGLPDTIDLIREKQPVFLPMADFDASRLGRAFDFVISHSILSHAAHWQYPLFLKGVMKVLATHGVALASIRFHDDNDKIAGDSQSQEWVYHGVSFFSWDTVRDLAVDHGFLPEWRPDYRQFFIKRAPSNYHDWLRLTHLPRHI
jgi:cyclopropane fatty-acyl-phospholipid synthase-like methyltransferase